MTKRNASARTVTARALVLRPTRDSVRGNTAIEFGNRLLTFPLAVIVIRRDQHPRQGTCNLPGVTLGAEEEVR
jgi:hypothetical protein